jgi:hypothetical protein
MYNRLRDGERDIEGWVRSIWPPPLALVTGYILPEVDPCGNANGRWRLGAMHFGME